MPCRKCSAELQGAKKFCGQCGAAVALAVDPFASTVQPNARPAVPAAPGSAPASVGLAPAPAPHSSLPSSRVSPLASSAFEFSDSVREIVVAADAAAAAAVVSGSRLEPASDRVPAGTAQMQQVSPRPLPTAPAPAKVPSVVPPSVGAAVIVGAPPSALGPGVAVRVRWANGQKYLGTIWQTHGTQVLVAFQDGQRHWVEAAFVERT